MPSAEARFGPHATRWAGPWDALAWAAPLSAAFAEASIAARLRFAVKVTVTPHLLTVPHGAIVGLFPHDPAGRGRWGRLADGVGWATVGHRRWSRSEEAPRHLAEASSWRVANLLAVEACPPLRSVRLIRTVAHLADRYRVVIEIDVERDDLRPYYLRHGFEPSERSSRGRRLYRRMPRPGPELA